MENRFEDEIIGADHLNRFAIFRAGVPQFCVGTVVQNAGERHRRPRGGLCAADGWR